MSRKGFIETSILGILIILLGIISVIVYSKKGSRVTPPPPAPSPIAMRVATSNLDISCTKDEECAIVETDCVGCSCDAQIAINKNSLEKFREQKKTACQNYKGVICDKTCGPEPANMGIVARCVQSRCTRGTQWVFVYDDLPFYTIQEINKKKLPVGSYRTSGYVVSIEECFEVRGSVPRETCLKPHIVISEKSEKALGAGSTIANYELVIITYNPRSRFQIGGKYEFVVDILKEYTLFTGRYIDGYTNDFRLGVVNGPLNSFPTSTTRGVTQNYADPGPFSILLPVGWKFNKLQGEDSYVGEFVGDGMRLEFDYGIYSGYPGEGNPNYTITTEMISGYNVKIAIPKEGTQIERKLTEIYFEGLPEYFGYGKISELGTIKLSIYGINLTKAQQDTALQIFRSVIIKKLVQ